MNEVVHAVPAGVSTVTATDSAQCPARRSTLATLSNHQQILTDLVAVCLYC